MSLWPAPSVGYNMLVGSVFRCRAWFRIVAMAPVVVRGLSTMSIPVIGGGGLSLGEPVGAQEVLSGLVVVALAARASPAA